MHKELVVGLGDRNTAMSTRAAVAQII